MKMILAATDLPWYALAPSSLAQCLAAGGTIAAVVIALFKDKMVERVSPIWMEIDTDGSEDDFDNTFTPTGKEIDFDECLKKQQSWKVRCHHLRVKITRRPHRVLPHRAIINCRVWLAQVWDFDHAKAENDLNAWTRREFAVRRLMEWAPHEYSADKRTFACYDHLDFGMTFENDAGFRLSYCSQQAGKFNRWCRQGQRQRFVFVITGDNYFAEQEFDIEVEVPRSGTAGFKKALVSVLRDKIGINQYQKWLDHRRKT
jgi:hypothetical protein